MKRDMKLFIAAVAVFCSYLIASIPFSSALQVNFIFNQASLGSVVINPQGLVNKDMSISHDSLWSRIDAHLEVRVAQPKYDIKRAYVYFCGGLDPVDCITKTPVTFESYVNVSKNWNDIFSGQAYRYPQISNILTLVRVDVGGKIVWMGFWDQIERTATKEFKIRSYDTSSADLYLKSGESFNLTRGFVEKYMMVPAHWVETTSFGMINQTDTQLLYGVGANQSEIPQLRPWKTLGKTLGDVGKEYEFVFPATASFIANPVMVNSNPPYICGNSVCETEAGENQENCCMDCTDPRTRACSGVFENFTCYVDDKNPYGYCGSKCGEKGCERGEGSRSCCRDCGCASGFICDVSQWNPSGRCINASAINLILDSAKTKYSCCEIPHDVELQVHIMNAPSDLNVQQWYYVLNTNETGTQISAKRTEFLGGSNASAPQMYSLKIHLDPLTECRRGVHEIGPNRLFALATYAGGAEFKELSLDLPEITIVQEAISMKEVMANMKERMKAIMDFIEDGIGLVKTMLMICIITIIAMLIIAALAGISYAFGGKEGEVFGPEGTTKAAGLPGPGGFEGGGILSFTDPSLADPSAGSQPQQPQSKTYWFRDSRGQRASVTDDNIYSGKGRDELIKEYEFAKYGTAATGLGITDVADTSDIYVFGSPEAANAYKPAELAKPAPEKVKGWKWFYSGPEERAADENEDGHLTWLEAYNHNTIYKTSVLPGDFTKAGKGTTPKIIAEAPLLGAGMELKDGAGSHYKLSISGDAYKIGSDGTKTLVSTTYDAGTLDAAAEYSRGVGGNGELERVSSVEISGHSYDIMKDNTGNEFYVRDGKYYLPDESGGVGNPIPKTTIEGFDAMKIDSGSDSFQVVEKSYVGQAWSGIKSIPGRVIGGIGKVARGFAGFFKEFGEGLKFGFDIAQTVCQVTSMLIQIFTGMTTVWAKYIAFQTCMEMYENQVGRGTCDQNPQSCVNQLLGCLDSLEGVKQDTQNMIPEVRETSYPGGRGVVSAQFMMYEVGRPGSIKETCDGRRIYFNLYYGFYSEIKMVFRAPSGGPFDWCGTDRYYGEADMKAFFPLREGNAVSASEIFNCGDGRYQFSIFGDDKNIGNLVINYKGSCEALEGKADKAYVQAGALLKEAGDALSDVSVTEKNDEASLSEARKGINAAKKYIVDGKEKSTIVSLLTAVNREIDKIIANNKVSDVSKSYLQTAKDKIEKAQNELK